MSGSEQMGAAELVAFREEMDKACVAPLWERLAAQSKRTEQPRVWRWSDLEPLATKAVRATGLDSAERRVLTLADPLLSPNAPMRVTSDLNAGIQILLPGESARPHRHTANALRFVIEGTGARTVVDGKTCPMEPGDLILTPSMTWHEHMNEGNSRVMWLDVLDVPLMEFLQVNMFEPGPPRNLPQPVEDAAFAVPGMMPHDLSVPRQHSPMFRYPWSKSSPALDALPPADDGSRMLRYVNPLTGGPVMSLLDCYLLRFGTTPTRPRRVSGSAVCFAAAGSGRSTIGDTEIEWQKNDVFSIPHWTRASHRATRADATLFMVTDDEVMRRLELWREEP
jgi:gentisate 1,2-dioxygenase